MYTIPAQSEKVACDMIFRGSVVAATFQFLQPLFVGGLIFRGGRCLLLLKILKFFFENTVEMVHFRAIYFVCFDHSLFPFRPPSSVKSRSHFMILAATFMVFRSHFGKVACDIIAVSPHFLQV